MPSLFIGMIGAGMLGGIEGWGFWRRPMKVWKKVRFGYLFLLREFQKNKKTHRQ
jgi:hypothetical protein